MIELSANFANNLDAIPGSSGTFTTVNLDCFLSQFTPLTAGASKKSSSILIVLINDSENKP